MTDQFGLRATTPPVHPEAEPRATLIHVDSGFGPLLSKVLQEFANGRTVYGARLTLAVDTTTNGGGRPAVLYVKWGHGPQAWDLRVEGTAVVWRVEDQASKGDILAGKVVIGRGTVE
jgi:hypothetical protein